MEDREKPPETPRERVWDGRGEALEDARLTQADARMADDLRLKLPHFRVMAHVGRQNHKRGWLRVSQTELAARWALHRNSINRAFTDLVAWGYLLQRTQQAAGESFCLYKVALDGEPGTPPQGTSEKRIAPAVQGGVHSGVCTPPDEGHDDDAEGGECTVECAGGSAQPDVHMCTVAEYTPAQPRSTPPQGPVYTTRAHRLPPTIAEDSPPTPRKRRGERERDALHELIGRVRQAGPARAAVVDGLLGPILLQRRFEAPDVEATIAALADEIAAAGHPAPVLAKALAVLLAERKAVVKPSDVADVLVRQDVLLAAKVWVSWKDDPQGAAAWKRYALGFPVGTPQRATATMLEREGRALVATRFPPAKPARDAA